MNNVADLIISIAVVAIPVIGGFVAKALLNNKTALAVLNAIGPLAKAAVVAVEKLGVDQYLEGELKKSKAVQFVLEGLAKLGFTKADQDIVANAVEKAYADLSANLEKVYPQKTEAELTADEKAIQKKELEDQIAKEQQELQSKQQKLAAMQNVQD
ncbi:phage holin [Liquorilactobacillus capillatus]|uniref:Holin n=1 Tax=Liquorilactobacillus capillatus DSM 19910 TaxID=1423731 RepID=A0A0R1MBC4_9LACO|nr:phage holin [Liquorilactobacillus capillatus]KRL02533.1 hypothetical protein FC81_GL000701 [Liquorilactobacillus capillatus DSM 19910]